ncbi:MAG TPA: oligosaccharide flippase family protein [Cyclobacteriaceae bacterium]|nr:oligosaccharide flippase family protein [Cyclobacteriaceae bacterium]
MGIVIRQSIYSTLISYLGVAIGYINLLYLYPKFLSLEQVGLFRTIQDAAILFTPFAQFGLTQSIFRFYPQLVKDQRTSHTFITLMALMALAGFAIFFLLFKIFETPLLSYFQDNAKEIIQYASLVLWLTLVLVMIAVLEAFSRSLLKTVVPNLLREVMARLFLSVLVLFYFGGFITFNQFIICSVLGYLLWLLILLFYLWKQGEISLQTNFTALDQTKFPELFKYSLLSFAGMAGLILIGKIDSMMVSALLGLSANAIYTTAFYMATVIEIPKRALSQLAMPLISRSFEKGDLKEVANLYRKTSINQFIIGSLLLIGVWINLDNLFALMPNGEHYGIGKWVVIIVGGGKLVDMLFGPSSEIIVLSKYYKFNILLILILAALIIVSNNLLIPRYGIDGAAWGAAFALVAFNITKYIFIYLKFDIQPFTVATGKVLAIAFITLLSNTVLFKFENTILDIIVRSSLITFIFGGLILITKSSPEANDLFKKGLNLFIKKKF